MINRIFQKRRKQSPEVKGPQCCCYESRVRPVDRPNRTPNIWPSEIVDRSKPIDYTRRDSSALSNALVSQTAH